MSDKAKSRQRDKARKPREMDPIKLVLNRGLAGKGVVLAPVQTSVLAKYILQLNATLDMMLADEAEEDDLDTREDKDENTA